MIQSLATAGLWGATDACAGFSARKSTPLLAAMWLHVASLLVLAPLLLAGFGCENIDSQSIALGMTAGVVAAIGDVLFGRALSVSAMTVGIPLSNVLAAAVPAAVVAFQGERITAFGAVGITGALVASVFAVMPSNGRLAWTGAGYAILAGLCFGAMYGLLSQVATASSLLVVFVMRVAGTVALSLPAYRQASTWTVDQIRLGAFTGLLSGLASVGANVLFVHAMSNGNRLIHSVVAIGLSSPAGMLISHLRYREKLHRKQVVTAAVAVLATVFLAVE